MGSSLCFIMFSPIGNRSLTQKILIQGDFLRSHTCVIISLQDSTLYMKRLRPRNQTERLEIRSLEREPSCTIGGEVNWCNNYGKQYGGSSKKRKIELSYDLEILLLGIYPNKTVIQKDTCTPMFTAALFTVAGTWKQPKCASGDEWIKEMWSVCTTNTTWS